MFNNHFVLSCRPKTGGSSISSRFASIAPKQGGKKGQQQQQQGKGKGQGQQVVQGKKGQQQQQQGKKNQPAGKKGEGGGLVVC
jgi:hypothetical protein